MKKTNISKYLLVCSILFFVTIAFLACNKSKKELIVNKWKIEEIIIPGQDEMISKMDSAQKASIIAELKQMKDNTTFVFNKDSTYEFDLGYTKAEGIYMISNDEKKILTKANGESKSESVFIDTLTNERLIIRQKDYSGKEITIKLVHKK
jgi:hypothetical protein